MTKEEKLELAKQKDLKRDQQLDAQKKNQDKKDGLEDLALVEVKEAPKPKEKPQEITQAIPATPLKEKNLLVKKDTVVAEISSKTPEEELLERKN